MTFIERPRDRAAIDRLLGVFPVVAIIGPRQSGKTTLAQQIAQNFDPVLYLDLEDPGDLAALEAPKTVLADRAGLVVIDEIQRRPELFPVLRVLIDRHPETRWLILGSASPNLLQQASESLAGRIGFHELGGFLLCDVGREKIRKLWLRGGFPRSFLASDDQQSALWRSAFISTFLERDVPQLGYSLPAPALRRLLTMIANGHGTIANVAGLSRDLGMSQPTVKRWIDLFEHTYVARVLQPWYPNVNKRLVKRPKIYIRDSGILHSLLSLQTEQDILSHPILGASWEGFAAEQLIRILDDGTITWYFWRTHAGAEADLVWQFGGRLHVAEIKFSDAPKVTPSMRSVLEDLNPEHLWVVHPGERRYSLHPDITAIPLWEICDGLT